MKKMVGNDKLNSKKIITTLILILIFGVILGTLCHEIIGHGLTAIILGGKVTEICIITFQINSSGVQFNPCVFGYMNYNLNEETPLKYGFILIMGSVFTFIISLIATLILLFKKIKGYPKIIIMIFSLYFMDIIYNLVRSALYPGNLRDFVNIYNYLDISIAPIIPIVIFGMFNTLVVLNYRIQNKNISKEVKNIIFASLTITLISLAIFLVYFSFEIYRLWY